MTASAQQAGGEAAKAVPAARLEQYSQAFQGERANRVAANAATANGILEAARGYQGIRELPRDFSTELKQGSITNQEQSGRCWMFAALNTLRFELMHQWNLEDFEFSENYLFFWDKIEKSNAYLENILATLDEPTDSRLFQAINDEPVSDGGWWEMFVNLVNKYGLMPKSAYPESANSRHSQWLEKYLNTRLHKFAIELRARHEQGEGLEELRELKERDLETVYRIVAIALGEPPKTFDFMARVKDGDDEGDKQGDEKSSENGAQKDGQKDTEKSVENGAAMSADASQLTDASAKSVTPDKKAAKDSRKDVRKMLVDYGITPMAFYKKYVPVDVNDYVTLISSPMARTPFNKRYWVLYFSNVAESAPLEFVNVAQETFRAAAIKQIQAGHPIWFACDCDQFSLLKDGYFAPDTVRVDELFGTDFDLARGESLEYSDALGNHAMTFTGLNMLPDGTVNRWKVENSWGKDRGDNGYYVGSAQWFDRFVTELIIRKDCLDEQTLAILETEPVKMQPWQAVSKACR